MVQGRLLTNFQKFSKYFVNPGELMPTKIDKSTVHTHQLHFLGKIWKSNARMITLSLIDLKKKQTLFKGENSISSDLLLTVSICCFA